MLWVKLKVAGEKIVIIGVYGPGMERSKNERAALWECFNESINVFCENERTVVLGDMNAKVGNRKLYRVVRKYGVLGINENGEKLVELCSEKRLSTGNT